MLTSEVLHILKLCLIFVGPTLCQFSKYKKKCFWYIHFFYKTKLNLIPQARNSTTELIFYYNVDKTSLFFNGKRVVKWAINIYRLIILREFRDPLQDRRKVKKFGEWLLKSFQNKKGQKNLRYPIKKQSFS